jgi:hypothetical protein
LERELSPTPDFHFTLRESAAARAIAKRTALAKTAPAGNLKARGMAARCQQLDVLVAHGIDPAEEKEIDLLGIMRVSPDLLDGMLVMPA